MTNSIPADPISGRWHPVGQPDRETPGYVTRDGDTLTLRLLGIFPGFHGGGHLRAITGFANGQPATLLQCRLTSERNHFRDHNQSGEQTWIVTQAILGAHVDDWEVAVFRSATAELDNLEGFMDLRLVDHQLDRDGTDRVESFTVKDQPEVSATVDDVTYRLLAQSSTTSGPRVVRLTYKHVLYITMNADMSLDTIENEYVRPMQYLLHLSTGMNVTIRSLHLGGGLPSDNNHPHSPTWEVLDGASKSDLGATGIHHNMQFSLHDFDFAAQYPLWITIVQKYRSTLDLLFARTASVDRYIEAHFLNTSTAAEGFHRRWAPSRTAQPEAEHRARIADILTAVSGSDRPWLENRLRWSNEPTLRDRLIDLADYAAPASRMYTGDAKKWAQRITDLRNALTHRPTGRDDVVSRDPEAAVYLEASLAAVLTTCLLRELSYSPEECALRINRGFTWSWIPDAMRGKYPGLFKNT